MLDVLRLGAMLKSLQQLKLPRSAELGIVVYYYFKNLFNVQTKYFY